MTTIFATDPTDSGEILHPSLVDTYVLDVGERTRNLAPYTHGLRPWRRPDSTGEQQVYRPLTIGVVDGLQEPPIGPVPPLPPPPPGSVYDRRPVKPLLRRGSHRTPRPVWAWLLLGVGAVLLVEAVAALVALAVLA